MENIQALLNQQADLAKKIAAAYGRDATAKQAMAQFKAIIADRKSRPAKFMAAFAEGKKQDNERALANAGWAKESEVITEHKSTWAKKGSSLKLVIDRETFKVVNGTEVTAGPLSLRDLIAYLNQAAKLKR